MKTYTKFFQGLVLSLTVVLFFSVQTAKAQEWLKYLPKYKSGQYHYTLKDYQKAFYTYWKQEHPNGIKAAEKQENEFEDGAYARFKRWEWFWQHRVNPVTGAFPTKSAYDVYKDYQAAHPGFKSANSQAWECLGPVQSDSRTIDMGRVNCVAFSPADTNVLYVGSASGGVWKSTDGGAHWNPTGDFNAVLGVADLVVVNDKGGQDIVYLATGDRDSWDTQSEGVLKSTDGGKTWKKTGLSFDSRQINSWVQHMTYKLLIDPVSHNILYASTSSGLYKTTDAGDTWHKINSLVFRNIQFATGSNSWMIGSTNDGKVYYSSDAGNTWNIALSRENGRHTEIAVAPGSSKVVYAIMANSQGGMKGFFRSTDTAKSFKLVLDTLNLLSQTCYLNSHSSNGGQGNYDLSITVDPHDTNRVFIGGINTWETTDGGKTWAIKNYWNPYCNKVNEVVHADKHYLVFQNGTKALYECNDGGIYKSYDEGNHWHDLSNGLVIGQLYTAGPSASVPGEVLTGLQDNGSKLLSGGNWTNILEGDVMECLIDPTDNNIQYASRHCGYIQRTTDHWTTSKAITDTIDINHRPWFYKSFVIDPKDHRTLYAGFGNVYKSTDIGDHWTKISSFKKFFNGSTPLVIMLAVAPSDNRVLYALAFGNSQTHLLKTTNGGKNWKDVSDSLPLRKNLPDWDFISISYKNPRIIWLVGRRHDAGDQNKYFIFQSNTGGKSWVDISTSFPTGIPINWLVQNKLQSPMQLYAATDVGVFVHQGASGWIPFNKGLPHVVVNQLGIRYDNHGKAKIYAATYGRGLWETNLPDSSLAPKFNAKFQADKATGYAPFKVHFTDQTEGPVRTSWQWNFGDDSTNHSQNPSHIYWKPGTYTVSFIAFSNDYQDTLIKKDIIKVLKDSTIHFIPKPKGVLNKPMYIGIQKALLDNSDLVAGDEIGIFDKDKSGREICVGAGRIRKTITKNSVLAISVSEDNMATTVKDGFKSGNTIYFKIWKQKLHKVFSNISATYDPNFDSTFQALGSAIVNLYAFGHYKTVWKGNPYQPMNILIDTIVLPGQGIQSGDEVGLFDKDGAGHEFCVGAGTVSGVVSSQHPLSIVASANDASTTKTTKNSKINGFVTHHKIIFKVWYSDSVEYGRFKANYNPKYDSLYSPLGTAVVKISYINTLNQKIPFSKGWNMMSLYVTPDSLGMLKVLKPLVSSGVLVKAIDEKGGFVQNIPGVGWMNTIGDMANTEGYYIKLTKNDTLKTSGPPVKLPFTIPLQKSWNIMGYPAQKRQDAKAAIKPLIDASCFVKVIGETGGFIQNVPGIGWINTLGNFTPGQGYYIKVTKNTHLTLYKVAKKTPVINGLFTGLPVLASRYFSKAFYGNPYYPMDILVTGIHLEGISPQPGDEMAVFDNGVCVGTGVVPENKNQPVLIVASMDDPSTPETDGYKPGDPISFRYMAPGLGSPIKVTPKVISGNLRFKPLATTVCGITASPVDINNHLKTSGYFLNIYPNPATRFVTFTINNPHTTPVEIEIVDLTGKRQKMLTVSQKGLQSLRCNISGLAPGIYIIRVTTPDHGKVLTKNHKFIIVK